MTLKKQIKEKQKSKVENARHAEYSRKKSVEGRPTLGTPSENQQTPSTQRKYRDLRKSELREKNATSRDYRLE